MSSQALTVANLSPDQRAAYDGIMSWLNRGTATKPTLTLGGYAGVGKSTVVALIAHELLKLGPIAFCAFTGKASSVLGRKLAQTGIATVNRIFMARPLASPSFEPRPYCGTIHGLVFRPCDARYFRRDRLDRTYRLIVVDEASMVSDDMLEVLRSYRIPILAVGDHGQLPPVRGTGSLMRAPDLKLEKIHRQAEGNPIIALSARIRATGDIDDSLEDGKAFTILSRRDLSDWIKSRFTPARLAADPRTPEGIMGTVLVSWTNKLRCSLNYDVREALGDEGSPKAGEVVICLKNAAPIYNGMRGVLMADAVKAGDAGGKAPKWKMSVDFVEDGQKAVNFLASEHQFFAEKTIDYDMACELGVSLSQMGAPYDFAYAMTCHKMQGSSAHEVGVVLEPGLARMSRQDRTAWLYTSATRAEKRLCIIR